MREGLMIDDGWKMMSLKGEGCCAPGGCFYGTEKRSSSSHLSEMKDSPIKVICSNEMCSQSGLMHGACFDAFEDSVLDYLKSSGQVRSWTEKQKIQNLWTKRGLELSYPACDCLCGLGKLRKDPDWPHRAPQPLIEHGTRAPISSVGERTGDLLFSSGSSSSSSKRRRKKVNSNNKKHQQTIRIGLPHFQGPNHPPTGCTSSLIRRSDAQNVPPRNRTNSVSSNTSGSSFTSSSGGELTSGSPSSSSDGLARRTHLQNRSRHDSGGSIFQRRLDYSSFNVLPKHKINSYHIKMEDECSIGNDETRIFILSSFATNKMNRVPCVMCKSILHIFDRYPLIDGTFFLSPRQHNKSCIQVKTDGKTNFLTAICMGCLEGWSQISCRFCSKAWRGSHLILGTMYSYDIFAATPCCQEKLKCSNCAQLVIHPEQRFNFFSDYSQIVSCPHCGSQDAHFAKSLSFYIRTEENRAKLHLQQQNVLQLSLQQQQQFGGMRVHRVNSA